MFIKSFLFFFTIMTLLGCSNLEFVYNFKDNIKYFHEQTLVNVSGDDSDSLSGYVHSRLKPNKSNSPVYELNIKSDKDVSASVIETDGTASKFSIKYNIRYKLKNSIKNCMLLDQKITTESFYDAKSSGYSFGTDISETESSINNLQSNADEFLRALSVVEFDNNCL